MTESHKYTPPLDSLDEESKLDDGEKDVSPRDENPSGEDFYQNFAKDFPGKIGPDKRLFEPVDPDPLD